MAGSVTDLGNGRYRLRVEGPRKADGRRTYPTKVIRAKTKREADVALAHFLVEQGQAHHLGDRDHTVGDLLDAWMNIVDIEATTRKDYESAIKVHIRPGLGAMPLHKLRVAHLDHFYQQLKAGGLGPARIRRLHSIIQTALQQAVIWEWIGRNVARDASPPPVPRQKPKAPTVEQVKQLLAAADGELLTWLRLAAAMGTRRGEVVGLRWSQVDFKTGEVRIDNNVVDGGKGVGLVEKATKTDRERRIPLGGRAVEALKEHRKMVIERALVAGVALQADGYVFSRDAAGVTSWRPEYPTNQFADLRASLGLPDTIKMRQLRHFVATQMIGGGTDVRTVSEIMGHSRTSTTQDFYADYLPVNGRAAADQLDELLG